MADITHSSSSHGVVAVSISDADMHKLSDDHPDDDCFVTLPFIQKVIAEFVGTFFLIFVGDCAVTVNLGKGVVTLPGVAIVWGLAVTVMVYSIGHISGAHINPAVTLAFASVNRFPWKEVPAYIAAQILGGTLASGTLRLLFQGTEDKFPGTLPSGTNLQSLVLEFIITFYLMFVISAVATDNRAVGELAGLAIGATVLLNVMIAGPVSGASMNPARSLGPVFVSSRFESIWIYILGPILGAIAGAWVYNIMRYTKRPLSEIAKTASFLKRSYSN
ncbi:hypothetical protein DCAR_0205775 [Daucus carota subsp. sativus]|uniref:Uncharacterized protein n=1 Tax=Daucus carota subsp. sativus TaxID=79200 RepID=A0A166CU34_DAUCS|nr:PREDICTED: aquaporin NIP1-1-like [Daucus carota subsp. sativus]WOG86562.1 hypothetical protein DCAR_0205775 [Daucus carota subsp. sativus]